MRWRRCSRAGASSRWWARSRAARRAGDRTSRSVQGDDLDVETAGPRQGRSRAASAGEAAAARRGFHVEVEQIGTDGFDLQEVWREVHQPQGRRPRGRGHPLRSASQPRWVSSCESRDLTQGKEGRCSIRCMAGVVGLPGVDKHPAPLMGDEGGVFHGCRSNQCHGGSIRARDDSTAQRAPGSIRCMVERASPGAVFLYSIGRLESWEVEADSSFPGKQRQGNNRDRALHAGYCGWAI